MPKNRAEGRAKRKELKGEKMNLDFSPAAGAGVRKTRKKKYAEEVGTKTF